MSKGRKKRYRKSYNVKDLKRRWALQRFDPKRRDAIIITISKILFSMIFAFIFVLFVFIGGIYKPIDMENAVSRSVEFDKLHVYHSFRGSYRYYMVLTNGEKLQLPRIYIMGAEDLDKDLEHIESGTPLNLKLHPDGTILEISTDFVGYREILNFDHAQKKLFEQSVIDFIIGILCGLGALALAINSGIMIIKHKVFAPSKSIYKKRY